MSGKKNILLYLKSGRGAILFLTLGIMMILLSLGVMFAAVTMSRHAITGNQKDALKARCIAESAVAAALSRLATNPGWSPSSGEIDFGGGKYSLDLNRLSDTEVEITAIGIYASARYRTCVVVHVPPSSGSVYAWALREGEPAFAWQDSYRAHDDARGPNADYAVIGGGIELDQGLAGFRVENVPYPITKVEFVIHYYIPQSLTGGRLEVRWRRTSDDAECSWVQMEAAELNAAVEENGLGFIAIDTTDHQPTGGWNWDIFTPELDFQIEVKSNEVNADETVWIDCAGFRISWGD